MVNDKDIDGVLSLMPGKALYYFTQAAIHRALPAEIVLEKANRYGLNGRIYYSVAEAVSNALMEAEPDDLIFIEAVIILLEKPYNFSISKINPTPFEHLLKII